MTTFFEIAVLGLTALSGVAMLAVLAVNPKLAFRMWVIGVALVPPWLYPQFAGFRVPIALLFSMAVIAAHLPKNSVRWRLPDTAVLALCGLLVIATSVGGTPLHIAVQGCAEWGACYAAGRFVVDRLGFVSAMRSLGVVLGIGAVLQAVLSFNLADLPVLGSGADGSTWASLQERAGFTRAELTFGHSIALGGTLAMILPFVLVDGSKPRQRIAAGIVFTGILCTLSRASIVGAVAGLGVVLLRSRASSTAKASGIAGLGFLAFLGWSRLSERLNENTYAVEVQNSTQYREDLLTLIPILRPVGLAPGGIPAEAGQTFRWLNFYSIDNALLLVGLYAGWLAAVLYLVPTIWLARKGIAGKLDRVILPLVVTQLPLILAVAPITQYQCFFWLMLGHAISRASGDAPSDDVAAEAQRIRGTTG